MARTATTIYLEENGEQLEFQITPMSAFASLMWSKKALAVFDISAIHAAGDRDEETIGAAFLSRLAEIPDDTFESLVEGLIKCCSIVRDKIPVQLTKDNLDGFFSERDTLVKLCAEALKANHFFQSSAPSGSKSSQKPVDIKRRA